jgi:hypothetical protein
MIESIVSVHMPKVAGSSFLYQLKELYGKHQLLLDYNDDPVNPVSIVNLDPDHYSMEPIKTIAPYKVVHGHFHPHKYAHLDNAFRITFLRHPIDNVMSIYCFWMAHDRSCWDSPVFHYFKDANLSLQRFAMLPKIRYLYTRSYFGDFDMRHFDFIGDYAKYNEELTRLGNRLGVQFDLNVRLNITMEYSKSSSVHEVDDKEKYEKLAEILKDDIAFYEAHKGR